MRTRAASKKKWILDHKGFQCGRKERFPIEEAAQDRVDGLKRAGKVQTNRHGHLRPYKCPKGDHWHIGHGDREE